MRFSGTEMAALVIAIKFLQTFTGVVYTHAFQGGQLSSLEGDAGSVVGKNQQQLTRMDFRLKTNSSPALAPGNSVLDGVFHQRLKQHTWNQRLCGLFLDKEFQCQPIIKTDFFNIEI